MTKIFYHAESFLNIYFIHSRNLQRQSKNTKKLSLTKAPTLTSFFFCLKRWIGRFKFLEFDFALVFFPTHFISGSLLFLHKSPLTFMIEFELETLMIYLKAQAMHSFINFFFLHEAWDIEDQTTDFELTTVGNLAEWRLLAQYWYYLSINLLLLTCPWDLTKKVGIRDFFG